MKKIFSIKYGIKYIKYFLKLLCQTGCNFTITVWVFENHPWLPTVAVFFPTTGKLSRQFLETLDLLLKSECYDEHSRTSLCVDMGSVLRVLTLWPCSHNPSWTLNAVVTFHRHLSSPSTDQLLLSYMNTAWAWGHCAAVQYTQQVTDKHTSQFKPTQTSLLKRQGQRGLNIWLS